MQDLGIDAWITIGTVVGMFTALLLTKLRPDAVFLAAIGVLLMWNRGRWKDWFWSRLLLRQSACLPLQMLRCPGIGA